MSTELNDDDVLSMKDVKLSLVGTTTFRINQLKTALQERFRNLTEGGYGYHWLEGIECEILKTSGGGWKKGTIRLRLELVLDEPEPEPEPVNDDPNSLDSLRTELYPKQ